MANNYTQFSEEIENITPEEATWVKEFLQTEAPDRDSHPAEFEDWCDVHSVDPMDDHAVKYYPYFSWALVNNNTALWLYSDESGDPDAVGEFVQAFLEKFRPEGVFTLTCSMTCSKPRISEFGGGWIVVSADKIKYGNTWTEASKAAEEMLKKE
jgi:hypothetical protein